MSRPNKTCILASGLTLAIVLGAGGGAIYYHASPQILGINLARVLSAPLMEKIYGGDLDYVRRKVKTYYRGDQKRITYRTPEESWKAISRQIPNLTLWGDGGGRWPLEIPFVYEGLNVSPLKELRQRYRIAEIAGQGTEYQRMMRLFKWIGTRWNHGPDAITGGHQTFRPAAAIAAGESGARFWCEIAARVTVHAASALGWPARLLTASKDGYHWDHALAEVWSNQFDKWFLVDTDYNVLYESDGVPLSGFELCHLGPRLRREGRLTIRRFAPLKAGLKDIDLLPFYRYVHIDLRNDWVTRILPSESPAGGDLSTWWTARKDLGPLLTAKTRVDNPLRFNWPVNWVEIYAIGIFGGHGKRRSLEIDLLGYGPYFQKFALRQDREKWKESTDGVFRVPLLPGKHSLEARILTESGEMGPPRHLDYFLQ